MLHLVYPVITPMMLRPMDCINLQDRCSISRLNARFSYYMFQVRQAAAEQFLHAQPALHFLGKRLRIPCSAERFLRVRLLHFVSSARTRLSTLSHLSLATPCFLDM